MVWATPSANRPPIADASSVFLAVIVVDSLRNGGKCEYRREEMQGACHDMKVRLSIPYVCIARCPTTDRGKRPQPVVVAPHVVHRTGVAVSLDARPTDALQARGAACSRGFLDRRDPHGCGDDR